MLQQTQVKTALPYYERWLAELPGFQALAAASPERVLKLWEGLGYYSRARNLHRLAQGIAALPTPPPNAAAWRELPGVGPYTAAAITSIALGQPEACVDGNVVRILARLVGDPTEYRDSASAAKAFTFLAVALLNPESPGDHNQAMMELGATVCLKHRPACLVCPVRTFCAAFRSGTPDAYPRLAARPTEKVEVVRIWSEQGGALLLHRAPATSRRLATQHELPTAEQAGLNAVLVSAGAKLLARRTRSITRFRITESIHVAALPDLAPSDSLVWVPIDRLEAITLSGPHRRWLTEILAERLRPTSPA